LPHFGPQASRPDEGNPACHRSCRPQPFSSAEIGDVPLRVFWHAEPSAQRWCGDRHRSIMYRYASTPPKRQSPTASSIRNKIGLDVAVEGLRAYREKKRRPDIKALTHFAQINRVSDCSICGMTFVKSYNRLRSGRLRPCAFETYYAGTKKVSLR
jgi:hypothetical protein